MKKFYFLFFNAFPCLVQAVGLNDVPEDPKKNIVGFLDQESWSKILRLNKEFYELTPQAITAIKVKGTADSIVEKLTALLFNGDAQRKVHDLESLNLTGFIIGDDELGTVVDFIQEYFQNIKSLNLSYNNIGASGVAHLSGLTQLQTLDLSANRIRESGVAHLSGLTQLQTLNLSANKIGASGVAHLAELSQLETLNLRANKIGASGVAHLSGFTQLQTLDLRMNRMRKASIDALSQALPNCVIEF